MTRTQLAELRNRLSRIQSEDLSTRFQLKACVAVMLRYTDQLELAFIRRAEMQSDRWSGQIAFPGGKQDPSDVDDFATASREVSEEIGITLERSEYLGQLSDLQARKRGEMLDFYIRPLVFFLPREISVTPSPLEVSDFFWFPVSSFSEPERLTTIEWKDQGLVLPAIRLKGDPPLWGLTYLMTQNLLLLLKDLE